MKLYAIRNWNQLYENNRSRQVVDLRWVAVPNRHDGETFSTIMAHPDGAVIFSAWILLIQIASKCTPRGTLIRDNGIPHNVRSLSVKCRAPDVWFERAILYLETETDWLVVTEFTKERQVGAPLTSGRCQAGDEERKEGMEWKEGKGGAHAFSETPSWKEFWDYCQIHGGPVEWYARDKFQAAEQDNWKGKSNWSAYADRIRTWWTNDGRPMSPITKNGDHKSKRRDIAI